GCGRGGGGGSNLNRRRPGRGAVVSGPAAPGGVRGGSGLSPPYRWHFGAVALETTLSIELDGPGVRQLCERDPGLGYDLSTRFMQVMLGRLQATRLRLLDLYKEPRVP